MKAMIAAVCVLSVVILQVSAGTRVVRDADDMMAHAAVEHKADDHEAKPHGDLDLKKVIGRALMRLRSHAGETLAKDLETLDQALNSGSLDKTLEEAKQDLAGQRFDLKKAIEAIRSRATGENSELITRIHSESKAVLDKLRGHVHNLETKIDDRVKAVADAIASEAASV